MNEGRQLTLEEVISMYVKTDLISKMYEQRLITPEEYNKYLVDTAMNIGIIQIQNSENEEATVKTEGVEADG